MKAVILVGGFGTRLRPLTNTLPKPLINFCNRPIVEYQINSLVKFGIKNIVLAVSYYAHSIIEYATNFAKKHNIELTISNENSPLGTAGPLTLIESLKDEHQFLLLNSDIICDYPWAELISASSDGDPEATIMITQVEDPHRFGVISFDEQSKIVTNFSEKPKNCTSNWINGGIYVIKGTMINRMKKGQKCSLEYDIFPNLCQEKKLKCYEYVGNWADIGKPQEYLKASNKYLHSKENVIPNNSQWIKGNNIISPVLADRSAFLNDTAVLGPNVCIGANCVIERKCIINNCVLLDGVYISEGSKISNAIIGWNSKIGKNVMIENLTIIGGNVQIDENTIVNSGCSIPDVLTLT